MISVQNFGDVTQFTMGRLIDGKPVYTIACYYIDGLLIDTGPFHVADEIEAAFADYPVDIIINTHHHEDHISNNIVFQQKLAVNKTYAHHLAVPLIENPNLWTDRLRAYQHLAWGAPPASKAFPIEETVKTPKYDFTVIHTPGHSHDHICLLEPGQGWLFSGDIFVREKVPTLRSDENVAELLTSLKKLLQYDFNTLFCSSGLVVEDAQEAIKRKIAYWEGLLAQVKELYYKNYSPEEIREKLLGKETILYGPSEGDFGKINLIMSFINAITKEKPI
ncbi:MAG: MBL fold metallo-hydrolase [Syntrophomonadaceae bacterium]|jgi:glyoxylase-like metal-dependent hydrolase (beta-lactamase superfamily II)|nr:MBL fold metallo-hydrolase [Syntrophomonadaceae bacterium]